MANLVPVTLQIRVPRETHERYCRAAEAAGLSVTNWMRTTLHRESAAHARPAPGAAPKPAPVNIGAPATPPRVSALIERLRAPSVTAEQAARAAARETDDD